MYKFVINTIIGEFVHSEVEEHVSTDDKLHLFLKFGTTVSYNSDYIVSVRSWEYEDAEVVE